MKFIEIKTKNKLIHRIYVPCLRKKEEEHAQIIGGGGGVKKGGQGHRELFFFYLKINRGLL